MSFALDFPAVRATERERPRGRGHLRGALVDAGQRSAAGAGAGQGQGQSGDERLSLGWLLNRNLKAILTSISLRVDDKTLRVSTSKSGLSIMSQSQALGTPSTAVQTSSAAVLSVCFCLDFGGPMKILSVLTIRLALALHAFLRAQTIHSFRSATRESKRR